MLFCFIHSVLYFFDLLVLCPLSHFMGKWQQETRVPSLGQEDLLEEEMTTHSSIFAWKTPWTEEPDGLQSMTSQRVGHG